MQVSRPKVNCRYKTHLLCTTESYQHVLLRCEKKYCTIKIYGYYWEVCAYYINEWLIVTTVIVHRLFFFLFSFFFFFFDLKIIAFECKIHTITILMHQMHILTTCVSSVMLGPNNFEIRNVGTYMYRLADSIYNSFTACGRFWIETFYEQWWWSLCSFVHSQNCVIWTIVAENTTFH
jgi:hypothetical protein